MARRFRSSLRPYRLFSPACRLDICRRSGARHANRFTVPRTQKAYVWPARHYASSITDTTYPPMGQRFRLKASFDTSGYPSQARVVLDALKKYGMIVSDNGGSWFITGQPDDRWDNDALNTLKQVKGSDFEAVDSSSLMITPDSGQARVTLELFHKNPFGSPDPIDFILGYAPQTNGGPDPGDRDRGVLGKKMMQCLLFLITIGSLPLTRYIPWKRYQGTIFGSQRHSL